MLNISILGSGSFGCSLASVYDKIGYNVTLWSFSEKEAKEIKLNNENKNFLPGIKIPKSINVSSNINDVFSSDIIFVVVPSFAVEDTVRLLKNNIAESIPIVCLSKGLEQTSLKLFSDIIKENLPNNPVVILSGPSHAEEIAKDVVTTLVAASENLDIALYVQKMFSTSNIRIYINNDIIGVQVAGALKNIIALATGICDGMELGDNTKAALMARGLYEISKLGVALGAKKETFYGLSGMGDLIVTCTSLHSRNKRAGVLIGQGLSAKEAIKEVMMVVEGYTCAEIAYRLSLKYNVEVPIISEVYKILYENKNPQIALKDLINRPYKFE